MKYVNIYRKFVLFSVTACAALMTSCVDFLTIIPPDTIVHEQYWQTKEDVDGILATSYLKLATSKAISRAIVWGELRADNMTFEKNKNKDDIRYIVEANINEENSYSDWSIYYQAINYANLLITYAPLVPERDPDFTNLDVVTGEMYALRALCHFYLLRAFRDIPIALEPAIEDGNLPQYAQVHPLEALDQIMKDLELAEKMVMLSGSYARKEDNYGRITDNAVLAIKADVNLWRAAFTSYYKQNGDKNELANVDVQKYYSECIDDCQTILNNMEMIYKGDKDNKETSKNELPYYLISNIDEFNKENKDYKSLAYNQIFVNENSRESIFELQIDMTLCSQESKNNSDGDEFKGLQIMYGATDATPQVEVPTSFLDKYETDDLRKYSFTNYPHKGTTIPPQIKIAKYVTKASPALTGNFRSKDQVDANWIVYRQTDVMLMMAEALVAQPSTNGEDIKKAFELANVINLRSRIDTTSTIIVNPLSEPTTADAALELVLDERLRELAFEGKRWFDLVRKALRENTTDNIKFVADKLTSGSASVKNRMLSIDNLFFPIYVEELRFNDLLKQNPAYGSEDSSIGIKK